MSTQTEQSRMPLPSHQEPFGKSKPGKGQPPRQRRKRNTLVKILIPLLLAFLIVLLGSDAQKLAARPAKKAAPHGSARLWPFHTATTRSRPGKSTASPLTVCKFPTADQYLSFTYDA